MSLSADLQQFSANFQGGYNSGSAAKYRASIEQMRAALAAQGKSAATDDQNLTYARFSGAAEAGKIQPGMTIPAGANYWASQNLPPNQYQAMLKGEQTAGYTPAQIAVGNQQGVVPMPAPGTQPAADPDAMGTNMTDYQMSQPPGQAKGGVVPMRRYASGGPIDPDVAAAVAQSNGQPNAPSPGGAAAPSQGVLPTAPAPAQAASAMAPADIKMAPADILMSAPAPPAPPAQAATAAPPGGMAPMHPAGLQPPANIDKPLPVPAGAVQAGTPAASAMAHARIAMGLHPAQNPGANPQQSAANYTELQHGAGAASNQQVHDFRTAVAGPNASSEPLGIQNASLLNNLYNYDLEFHGPQQAAADAFGVLQNYRINMQMYGGAALSAFQSGNLKAAADYMKMGYAFFPDGNDVNVTPGPKNSLIATRIGPDGKVLDTSTFTSPSDLKNFLLASTSFEGYNTMLAQEQDTAIKGAVAGAHINLENTEASDNSARTGAYVADTSDEISDRDQTTADDNKRTAYTTSDKGPKAPTAEQFASYQAALTTQLNGNLGTSIGFDRAPPAAQTRLVSLATSIGLANNLDPSTSAQIGGYVMQNPGIVKNGTVTLRGQTFQIGNIGTQMLAPPQGKATGGAVSPAARAMADLP
jgi:hypothetical protein